MRWSIKIPTNTNTMGTGRIQKRKCPDKGLSKATAGEKRFMMGKGEKK
jgi:hypothetical protein